MADLIYRWTGATNGDIEAVSGTNWRNEFGVVWGTGVYPGNDDIVMFDSTVTNAPSLNLNQNGKTYRKFLITADYDKGMGSAVGPYIFAAQDIMIEGQAANTCYIASLPLPDATLRLPTSPLDSDYTTFDSAQGEATDNVIYVFADAGASLGSETEFVAVDVDSDHKWYGIGHVAFVYNSGVPNPVLPVATAATSDCLFDGFVIKDGTGETNGGGIAIATGSGCTFKHCIIKDNDATNGGGLWISGAHASGSKYDIVFEDCVFDNNTGTAGAGLYLDSLATGAITFNRCRIQGNTASAQGGGLYTSTFSGTPDINFNNCLFTGNTATGSGQGGALWIRGYQASEISFDSCTIADNVAVLGGAIYMTTTSNATFTNCIAWDDAASGSGNEVYIVDGATDAVTCDYCDFEGITATSDFTYGANGPSGSYTNGMNSDPSFLTTGDDPYNIPSGSAVVSQGATGESTDILGRARPVGTDDIGAYEYSTAETSSTINFTRKFGNLWVMDLKAVDTTLYIEGEIGNLYNFKGTVVLGYYTAEVLTVIADTHVMSFNEAPSMDSEVTLTWGVVPAATIEKSGGVLTTRTNLNAVKQSDGTWIHDPTNDGADIVAPTLYGGSMEWENGDVVTFDVYDAELDASGSRLPRTYTTLNVTPASRINLADRSNQIIHGTINGVPDELRVAEGSVITVA